MPDSDLGSGSRRSVENRLTVAEDHYRRGDTQATVDSLVDAVHWQASSAVRCHALRLLGMAQFELARVDEAIDSLRGAAEEAKSCDPALQFQAAFALFIREADFQRPDQSLQNLTTLRQLAASNGDGQSLAGLHLAVARLDGVRGHVSSAQEHITTASRLARDYDLAPMQCLADLVAASIATTAGTPDEAHQLAQQALDNARALHDVRLELHAESLLALACLHRGQAEASALLAQRVASRSGSFYPVRIAALDTLAQALLAQKDVHNAELALREAQSLAKHNAIGRLWNDLESDITRCHLAEHLGHWDEVQAIASRAEPETDRRGLRALRSALLCAQARAASWLGRSSEADGLLSEAAKCLPRVCLDQLAVFHASKAVCSSAVGAWSTRDQHFERASLVTRTTGRRALELWVEEMRSKLARPDEPSRSSPELPPMEVLERLVGVVSDLHSASGSLELLAARVAAVLAVAGLAEQTSSRFFDCPGDNDATDWKLRDASFEMTVRRDGRGVALKTTAVNDLTQIAFLVAVADAARLVRHEELSDGASELWPQPSLLAQSQQVYQSARMRELLDVAVRLTTARLPVLITGETGTGKEILARLIHDTGPARSGPFVPFNCSAIPRELVESQLFGHRRGAFTGAVDSQPGIIRSAEHGTLFLDEIGDLDPTVQPKLLRFLESSEVHPVGESRARTVSVRVVAATNANLEALVEQGRFREDLFYRVGAAPLLVPPLRERKDEIPGLAAVFLDRFSRECGRKGVRFSDDFIAALLLFGWPGNIRQLANEVRRAVAMSTDGQTLGVQDLAEPIGRHWRSRPAPEVRSSRPSIAVGLNQDLASATAELEAKLIEHALDVTGGHVSEAARLLGLSRKGLFLKRRRRGLLGARDDTATS